jgi:hypothetical protein
VFQSSQARTKGKGSRGFCNTNTQVNYVYRFVRDNITSKSETKINSDSSGSLNLPMLTLTFDLTPHGPVSFLDCGLEILIFHEIVDQLRCPFRTSDTFLNSSFVSRPRHPSSLASF